MTLDTHFEISGSGIRDSELLRMPIRENHPMVLTLELFLCSSMMIGTERTPSFDDLPQSKWEI